MVKVMVQVTVQIPDPGLLKFFLSSFSFFSISHSLPPPVFFHAPPLLSIVHPQRMREALSIAFYNDNCRKGNCSLKYTSTPYPILSVLRTWYNSSVPPGSFVWSM
ncbi:hypothetical protein V8C40DRAFT_231956, partial [Trichoderma camerunense]